MASKLFNKLFNELWESVDAEDYDEMLYRTGVKSIWDSIKTTDEYCKIIKTTCYISRQAYGRDEFYKWIRKTKTCFITTKGFYIKGLKLK